MLEFDIEFLSLSSDKPKLEFFNKSSNYFEL